MSTPKLAQLKMWRSVPCKTCGAKIGDWCRTLNETANSPKGSPQELSVHRQREIDSGAPRSRFKANKKTAPKDAPAETRVEHVGFTQLVTLAIKTLENAGLKRVSLSDSKATVTVSRQGKGYNITTA